MADFSETENLAHTEGGEGLDKEKTPGEGVSSPEVHKSRAIGEEECSAPTGECTPPAPAASLEPDPEASAAFLRDFLGEAPRHLVAIDKSRSEQDKNHIVCGVFKHDEDERMKPWIEKKNRSGYEIYFTPNPLRKYEAKKAGKKDVAGADWLWTDDDPPKDSVEDLDAWRAEKLVYQPEGAPLPTFVIDSGRGVWRFYKLKERVQFEGENREQKIALVESYGEGLEQAFGASADNCRNVDRVARLPGTINHKTGALARVVEYHSERTYALEDFPKAKSRSKTSSAPLIDAAGAYASVNQQEYKTPPIKEMKAMLRLLNQRKHFAKYDDWIMAGMMLKLAYGDEGFDLWAITHRDKEAQKTAENKWDSFDEEPRYGQATIGTLIKAARDAGFKSKAGDKATRAKGDGPPPKLKFLRGDEIEPEELEWVWDGWIAKRKLHLLAGPPKGGKTLIAGDLAARITQGGQMPDGSTAPPGNVVFWSGEDGIKDTLLPRMMAAGGDRSRMFFVHEVAEGDEKRSFDPATDLPALEEAIQEIGGASLIIVDPVVNAVTGDSHKNAEVRRSLAPLVDLAERTGAAILGITHFSKGSAGGSLLDRFLGSIAFVGLSRFAMVAMKNENVEAWGPPRILVQAASNLSKEKGGFGYDIEEGTIPGFNSTIPTIDWLEPLEGSAREIVENAEERKKERTTALSSAEAWLTDFLSGGRKLSTEVEAAAAAAGHSEKTLKRAKKSTGVVSKKVGDSWYSYSLFDACNEGVIPEAKVDGGE
jgi:putative DNA primase/helicase